MNRYEVTATASGLGKVTHVVKAYTPAAAKARIQRAYSDREVIVISAVRLGEANR